MMKSVHQISLVGLRVDVLTKAQLAHCLVEAIRTKQHVIISYVNVHAFNLAQRYDWFKQFLSRSYLVFCDGFGIQLGARLLNTSIDERIPVTDWIYDLAALSASHNFSLFFVGARPNVAQQAAEHLQTLFPTLQIAGVHHGFFDKACQSHENQALLGAINRAKPDILVVGLGMPLQEKWLSENWDHINAHVALTGGAVFDYTAGVVRRPPGWMTRSGLEWFGRMLIEPRRLWRRYLLGNPQFLWQIWVERLRNGR